MEGRIERNFDQRLPKLPFVHYSNIQFTTTKDLKTNKKNGKKKLTCSVFKSDGDDGDKVLVEIWMQHIRQITRAAFYIHTFACRDGQVLEMVNNIFANMNTSTGFLVDHPINIQTSKHPIMNRYQILPFIRSQSSNYFRHLK